MSHPDLSFPLLRQASEQTVHEGLTLLDEFMAAFNARDARRWAETLHYPHVRLAGDQVTVWRDSADYADSNDIQRLGDTGWHHSQWDWRHPVQLAEDKLHFAVQFTRYNADHQSLGSHQALYVLTRQQGKWGVQARSSYAGIAVSGAAF
ncbi:hypothetical protein FACS1894154_08960 [Betaproteobacteria bacterium]|nr:hypothetical protein FACS1894154_08960 [Betaproteobacteria bacterium]